MQLRALGLARGPLGLFEPLNRRIGVDAAGFHRLALFAAMALGLGSVPVARVPVRTPAGIRITFRKPEPVHAVTGGQGLSFVQAGILRFACEKPPSSP